MQDKKHLYAIVHNCEHHSSFDFIFAVLIWFISYTSITFISYTGTYELIIDQFRTSVASQLSWLEHRTGIARSRVQIPLKSWIFFQVSSYTQLHKLPSQLRGSFYIRSFLNEMANHFIRPGFPVSPDIKLVPGDFLLRKYGDGPWNEIELKWTSTIFCYW